MHSFAWQHDPPCPLPIPTPKWGAQELGGWRWELRIHPGPGRISVHCCLANRALCFPGSPACSVPSVGSIFHGGDGHQRYQPALRAPATPQPVGVHFAHHPEDVSLLEAQLPSVGGNVVAQGFHLPDEESNHGCGKTSGAPRHGTAHIITIVTPSPTMTVAWDAKGPGSNATGRDVAQERRTLRRWASNSPDCLLLFPFSQREEGRTMTGHPHA